MTWFRPPSPFKEREDDGWDEGRPTWWMAAWRGEREYDRAYDAWLGPIHSPEWEWYRGLSRWERFTHDWFGVPEYPG